jgi:uncharacterized membrane protein (DUF485 family)
MAGLDHHAAAQEPDDPRTAARNTRYGLVLFFLYTFIYASFVLLNAFRPDWMAWTPLAGINLAVSSGLALIVGALVLSLVYGWLCRLPVGAEDERTGDQA